MTRRSRRFTPKPPKRPGRQSPVLLGLAVVLFIGAAVMVALALLH